MRQLIRRRVAACALVTALLAVTAAGCGTRDEPSGAQAGSTTSSSSDVLDPIDWLLDDAEVELSNVPGSTWTTDRGVTVAAVCSPTDAHEGWRMTGVAVAPGKGVPDSFDGGEAFALARADEPRRWSHRAEENLSLVERDDGRVEFELFVPVGDAPDWDAIDQIDVEIAFSPSRCG